MKTTRNLGFTLLLAVLLAPSCKYFQLPNDPPSPQCEIGEPFWLRYGQTAECADWNVTFTGTITDSRCPSSVTCVWAGRVDIELQIGNELISLGLPDDAQLGPSKDTLGNRVIELLEVFPYPITPDPIDNESYRIRLSVANL